MLRLLLGLSLLVLPLALAGCMTPAAAPEAPIAPDAETEPGPTEVPVSLDGFFGLDVVYCGETSCDWLVNTLYQDRWLPLETSGNLTAVNLTATWTPSSPLMERLALGIATCEKEGCYTRSEATTAVYVEGSSPLTLQLDAFPVEPGQTVYVVMVVTEEQPAPVWLTTPQDFHIEGALAQDG